MIEITKIFLWIVILLVFIFALRTMLRQLSLDGISTSLTFNQKVQRSLIAGCMLSILFVCFLAALLVYAWNDGHKPIDFHTILTMTICIVIAGQIGGTVGTFNQLTYINFLLKTGTKK